MTLGLLVTGVTYRHPGLLAKIVTTLDVLSGGRARLGIGAAWYEREHLGLGVPVVPVARAVRAAGGDAPDLPADVERRQRSVRRASTTSSPRRCAYRSRSAGRARAIMIGGGGEKKTLRLVARYADACNLFGSSVEDVAHKLDVLRRTATARAATTTRSRRPYCSCRPVLSRHRGHSWPMPSSTRRSVSPRCR